MLHFSRRYGRASGFIDGESQTLLYYRSRFLSANLLLSLPACPARVFFMDTSHDRCIYSNRALFLRLFVPTRSSDPFSPNPHAPAPLYLPAFVDAFTCSRAFVPCLPGFMSVLWYSRINASSWTANGPVYQERTKSQAILEHMLQGRKSKIVHLSSLEVHQNVKRTWNKPGFG